MNEFKLRSGALEWREVEGEIVALDLRTELYLAINPAGAALWPALAQGGTRAQLVARLTDTFDIDEDAAGRDVDAFLRMLAEQDLLGD